MKFNTVDVLTQEDCDDLAGIINYEYEHLMNESYDHLVEAVVYPLKDGEPLTDEKEIIDEDGYYNDDEGYCVLLTMPSAYKDADIYIWYVVKKRVENICKFKFTTKKSGCGIYFVR